MTQIEFYKSFQFVLELLFAESIYLLHLRKKNYFFLRLILSLSLIFIFSFFFPVLYNNTIYTSFMFFAIFAFSVLVCKLLFHEKWLTIFFCCFAGYTTQHLSYEIYNLFMVVMGVNLNTPLGFYGKEFVGMFSNLFLAFIYFFTYIITYFLCSFIFGQKIKKDNIQLKLSFIFVMFIVIVVVDVILGVMVVYNAPTQSNKIIFIILGIYNILCCLFSLYLQFEVALRERLEYTVNTVQQMCHKMKEQYAISKENIDIINMKCHDLKHQIHLLQTNKQLGDNVIKDLENRISIYDSVVKTENDTLDIILAEKSLICNKNHIKLNCMIDGKKLSFMSQENIYTLFGNILDNAIEAVLKLEEEKRIINLHIKESGDILSVIESNYYKDTILFKDGIPQTTKDNKIYHGYGIKSIKYICDEYNSDLSINTDKNIYTISILFFLGENIK